MGDHSAFAGSTYHSVTLAKNPQLRDRAKKMLSKKKPSGAGKAPKKSNVNVTLSYNSFVKTFKPTQAASGTVFGKKTKNYDRSEKLVIKKQAKVSDKPKEEIILPTKITRSSTKRKLKENLRKALKSHRSSRKEAFEDKYIEVPDAVELTEKEDKEKKSDRKIEEKAKPKGVKKTSLQIIASATDRDAIKAFKRKFFNICRELENAYKVMHLSLYEYNNNSSNRSNKTTISDEKRVEIKRSLNMVHVLQNWINDCVKKLDRLDDILGNKDTDDARDEMKTLLKFFENLPNAKELESEIYSSCNKDSVISFSSLKTKSSSSEDRMGEPLGDVEEHHLILPNEYADYDFTSHKNTDDGFIDILKVKEKRDLLPASKKASTVLSKKKRPKLSAAAKKQRQNPHKKPKDLPGGVSSDGKAEDKYKNSLFFGSYDAKHHTTKNCQDSKCTCQMITDKSSVSHTDSAQINFIQAKLSQIKDKDNYISCYDMLDELQPKDLAPLQAEYPRKDFLKPATYLKAKNTFLYDLLYNKNVSAKKLLKVRWEKWGDSVDQLVEDTVTVMMVRVGQEYDQDVDKMKTAIKLAPYIYHEDDKWEYNFGHNTFSVLPVSVSMQKGDCKNDNCNLCKSQRPGSKPQWDVYAKKLATRSEMVFPTQRQQRNRTQPPPKNIKLTATGKITVTAPKAPVEKPPNAALQELKQAIKGAKISTTEMKVVHGYLQEVIAIMETRLFFALTLPEKGKSAEYARIEKEIVNVLNIIYPYYKRKDGYTRPLHIEKNSSHILLEKLRSILSSDSSVESSEKVEPKKEALINSESDVELALSSAPSAEDKSKFGQVMEELLEKSKCSVSVQTSALKLDMVASKDTFSTADCEIDIMDDLCVSVSTQTSQKLLQPEKEPEKVKVVVKTESDEDVLTFLDKLTIDLRQEAVTKAAAVNLVPKLVQFYLNRSAYEVPILHLATVYYQSCWYDKAKIGEHKKRLRLKKIASVEILPYLYVLLCGLVYVQFFIGFYKCQY